MPEKNNGENKEVGFNAKPIVLTVVMLLLVGLIVFIFIKTNPYKDMETNQNGIIDVYGFAGSGTITDPFLISNAEDFCHFRDMVNVGYPFSGCYFLQTVDIDLSGIDNWEPIGVYESNRYFYGSYDGGGHTLSNLTIKREDNCGLFGILFGEVRNLGIESGYIEGSCVGSVASHGVVTASIINCYNKAEVHGTYRAGGIADNFQGKIDYCWNLGKITCDTGTLAGVCSYAAQIDSCYSYKLPIVPAEFQGSLTESREFSVFDEADWMERLHLAVYNDEIHRHPDNDRISYIVVDGDTVTFDSGYFPGFVMQKKIERFLSNYGAILILAVVALIMIIIATRRPKARGTVLTLFLIVVGIEVLNNTLMQKYPVIITMQNYYQQPDDSVDVLMLGSSRVGFNQECEVLWENYGISSYNLWGNVQPAWNSYYFLNEALKCGTPKVVVFDVVALHNFTEFADDVYYHTNTYGMKLSLDKLEAIQATAPQEMWSDLLLGFPIYHTRYSELTQNDFQYYPWSEAEVDHKGFTVRYGTGTMSAGNAEDVKNVTGIRKDQEEFFYKIVDRCKSENISLLLIASNVPNRSDYQPSFNYVAELADKLDLPFINYNLLDAETGYNDADLWTDGHLNTTGARKQSMYLGQYLKEHYSLTDHRGDPYYSSWEEFSVYQQNSYIPLITDRNDYLKELIRDDKTVIVVKQSVDTSSEAYEAFLQDAANCGFDMSILNSKENGCWVIAHPANSNDNEYYSLDQDFSALLGGEELTFNYYGRNISYADEMLTSVRDGITCIVYDTNTNEIVDKSLIYTPASNGIVTHL